MPTRSAKNKAKPQGRLLSVLKKVAPFLFGGYENKKKPVTHHSRNKIPAFASGLRTGRQDTGYKTRSATKAKRSGKPSAQRKHPARHPAATLSARKTSAPVSAAPASAKKLKGRFLLEDDKPETDAKAVTSALLADAKEDSFLSKVALKEEKVASTTISGWSLLKNRLFAPVSLPSLSTKKEKTQPVMTADAMKQDSFLQRVQQKNTNAVVGTAVDADDADGLEELATAPRDSGKEQKKGRILSAVDLRKETKEAKEATARLEKEVKEIKAEMKGTGASPERDTDNDSKQSAPVAKPKVEEEPVTVHVGKHIGLKKKNGFQQFLAGIGNFGLGKERTSFIQNLATMLNAGLPLVDAIRTLQMETRPKPMKKLLQRIVDMVDNGSPLWRAMEAQSFFTPHALALVRIGEEAGNLAGNMVYLAAQDEKDHELKSKVKMAMIYPSIVLTIMAVIIVVLGMFVLPNLIGVLIALNVPLPLTTRVVIWVSNAFTEYGTVGIPAVIGGVILLIILNKYTSLKVVIQWVTFRVPGVGRLAREATIARFGVILGGLLKAGVPVTEAVQSLVEVTTIVSYRRFYERMLDHITVGDSFAKSFNTIKGSTKLLPPSVQQLVITGEKSGALADIMLKIADIYDKKASETAQKLPVILEPMLLLFIGGLVGTIAFSILVPIYSIVGNVGR